MWRQSPSSSLRSQFVRTRHGWREVMVDTDDDPSSPLRFRFAIAPGSTPATTLLSHPAVASAIATIESEASAGGSAGPEVAEVSPAALSLCEVRGVREVLPGALIATQPPLTRDPH